MTASHKGPHLQRDLSFPYGAIHCLLVLRKQDHGKRAGLQPRVTTIKPRGFSPGSRPGKGRAFTGCGKTRNSTKTFTSAAKAALILLALLRRPRPSPTNFALNIEFFRNLFSPGPYDHPNPAVIMSAQSARTNPYDDHKPPKAGHLQSRRSEVGDDFSRRGRPPKSLSRGKSSRNSLTNRNQETYTHPNLAGFPSGIAILNIGAKFVADAIGPPS